MDLLPVRARGRGVTLARDHADVLDSCGGGLVFYAPAGSEIWEPWRNMRAYTPSERGGRGKEERILTRGLSIPISLRWYPKISK